MIDLIILCCIAVAVIVFLLIGKIKADKAQLFTKERVVYSNDEYSLVLVDSGHRNLLNFVVVEKPLAVNSIVSVLNWDKVTNARLRYTNKNWYLVFFNRKINNLSSRRKNVCEAIVRDGSDKTVKLKLQLFPLVWIADYEGQACILTIRDSANYKPNDRVSIDELSLCSSKMISILK